MAESIVALRNRLENFRSAAKVPVVRTMAAATGIMGAATSGAVRAMGYEKLPGTQIDTDLALGGAALAASIAGVGGKASGQMLAFGLGLAAPAVSRMTETAVREWRAK